MKTFRRINIEISNICNLQCSFCPEVERDKKVMTLSTFKEILPQVAPITDEICLHLMGEPLGHPEFLQIVYAASQAQVPLNISTNGILLSGLRCDWLLNPIVRQINFSVHSFSANFPNQDPRPYIARILKFTRRALHERPDLYINFRLWDIDSAGAEASENQFIRELIADEFNFDLSQLKLNLRKKKGYPITGRVYFNFDSRFEWPNPKAPFRSKQGTCQGLKTHFGIHADGTVVPCCLDKEGDLALGNVNENSIADILQSAKARNIRSGFDAFELREDLCQRCTFVSRFRSRKSRPARSDYLNDIAFSSSIERLQNIET